MGKCVVNTPHFDAACDAFLSGAANALVWLRAGLVAAPNGQCAGPEPGTVLTCCTPVLAARSGSHSAPTAGGPGDGAARFFIFIPSPCAPRSLTISVGRHAATCSEGRTTERAPALATRPSTTALHCFGHFPLSFCRRSPWRSCGPLFDSPPDTTPLDPAFDKQWRGIWTITVEGTQPSDLNGVLSVLLPIDGRHVDLAPICFGGGPGTGSAFQDGSQRAHWEGTLVCALTAFDACPSEVFTLAFVGASLMNNGISVRVRGSVTGRGTVSTFDMTFTGTWPGVGAVPPRCRPL